jgi:ribosomal protein L40E
LRNHFLVLLWLGLPESTYFTPNGAYYASWKKKKCERCGEDNGPRSWNCQQCGFGFTLRGEKKPDLDVTSKPARSDDAQSNPKRRLWNLVELYEGDDDKRRRKKYGVKGRTWQSKCGRYRIREQLTFMGVDMAKHYSKCVYLLKWEGAMWEIVRPKGRFKTLLAAIRRMVKDVEGRQLVATTKRDQMDIRIAELNRHRPQMVRKDEKHGKRKSTMPLMRRNRPVQWMC